MLRLPCLKCLFRAIIIAAGDSGESTGEFGAGTACREMQLGSRLFRESCRFGRSHSRSRCFQPRPQLSLGNDVVSPSKPRSSDGRLVESAPTRWLETFDWRHDSSGSRASYSSNRKFIFLPSSSTVLHHCFQDWTSHEVETRYFSPVPRTAEQPSLSGICTGFAPRMGESSSLAFDRTSKHERPNLGTRRL